MKFTLEVEQEELNVIAAGLNELPRKLSQPVFAKLQEQVTRQDAEAMERAREAVKKVSEKEQAEKKAAAEEPQKEERS